MEDITVGWVCSSDRDTKKTCRILMGKLTVKATLGNIQDMVR
jgi:hypothetical protein